MKRNKEYWEEKLSKNVKELRQILLELQDCNPSPFPKEEELKIPAFFPVDNWAGYVCEKLAIDSFFRRVDKS